MRAVLTAMFALAALPAAAQDLTDWIDLPPGFRIALWGETPQARTMVYQDGEVWVGNRQGVLTTLADRDGDGRAEERRLRAEGLSGSNGIAFHEGDLVIGMAERLARAADGGRLETIVDGFNPARSHGWRYVGVGPDGMIYVALGAPCNICDLTPNTGKIIRVSADGGPWEVVADGVRNSVGFDWHPVTGDLWFTDNGADRMGDDIPADELNRASTAGGHYGFPWRGGADTPLTGSETIDPPVEVIGAEVEFQAHSANLGIDFYTGDMFPAEYRNDAFVAQHGSWNRSEKVGYRVMRVRFDDAGNPIGKEVFADGFLQNGRVMGRPVDLEELPDGSLLLSDDYAGVIYRITYEGE